MLHTSDIHIAGDDRSMKSLRAVAATARESAVDLVLIAGDLFDNSRVGDDAVAQTLGELRQLESPVVVIPGNHDCVDAQSIYQRVDLTSAGDHVFFAGDPAGEELVFADLSLIIWARGIENHDPGNRPLAGYAPSDPDWWRVVLTHGHYVERGEPSSRSSQITQEEIGQLQCDYLALGHWHRFVDVSEGDVRAFYSGSPGEPMLGGGTVNLVTLDPDAGVHVERRAIGPISPDDGRPPGRAQPGQPESGSDTRPDPSGPGRPRWPDR
jgi:DNA repair exonuclease SbcCD nuclease subunit